MKTRIAILSIFLFGFSHTSICQEITVGQVAPEIIMVNREGNEIKLSDLRGQMVLVEFWASWCAPCRRKNPQLVRAYKNYKDSDFKNGKGLTVFSVSLDVKEEQWLNAIKDDNLEWPHHFCDFKGWRNEAAKDYSVRAIPANFLLDADGVILEMNLRGDNIDSTIKKYRAGWFWNLLN